MAQQGTPRVSKGPQADSLPVCAGWKGKCHTGSRIRAEGELSLNNTCPFLLLGHPTPFGPRAFFSRAVLVSPNAGAQRPGSAGNLCNHSYALWVPASLDGKPGGVTRCPFSTCYGALTF